MKFIAILLVSVFVISLGFASAQIDILGNSNENVIDLRPAEFLGNITIIDGGNFSGTINASQIIGEYWVNESGDTVFGPLAMDDGVGSSSPVIRFVSYASGFAEDMELYNINQTFFMKDLVAGGLGISDEGVMTLFGTDLLGSEDWDPMIVFDSNLGEGTLRYNNSEDLFDFNRNITAPNICYSDGTNCMTSAGNSSFNQSLTDDLYVKRLGDTMLGPLNFDIHNITFDTGIFDTAITTNDGDDTFINIQRVTGDFTSLKILNVKGAMDVEGHATFESTADFIDNVTFTRWITVNDPSIFYSNLTIEGLLSAPNICYSDGTNCTTTGGGGNDTQKDTVGPYLYNNSDTIFFNETVLNATIDNRASGGDAFDPTQDYNISGTWVYNKTVTIRKENQAPQNLNNHLSVGPTTQTIGLMNIGNDENTQFQQYTPIIYADGYFNTTGVAQATILDFNMYYNDGASPHSGNLQVIDATVEDQRTYDLGDSQAEIIKVEWNNPSFDIPFDNESTKRIDLIKIKSTNFNNNFVNEKNITDLIHNPLSIAIPSGIIRNAGQQDINLIEIEGGFFGGNHNPSTDQTGSYRNFYIPDTAYYRSLGSGTSVDSWNLYFEVDTPSFFEGDVRVNATYYENNKKLCKEDGTDCPAGVGGSASNNTETSFDRDFNVEYQNTNDTAILVYGNVALNESGSHTQIDDVVNIRKGTVSGSLTNDIQTIGIGTDCTGSCLGSSDLDYVHYKAFSFVVLPDEYFTFNWSATGNVGEIQNYQEVTL